MAAVPQYRRVWRDFLEAYMSMPCLWQVRCPDYGNREKRDECYYKLAEMCRQIEPMANKEFVLKKINCYRTTFRKELKKALDAQRKGSHYEPTLWYYRILLPVAEQQPTSPVVKVEKIEDHSAIHSAMLDASFEAEAELKVDVEPPPPPPQPPAHRYDADDVDGDADGDDDDLHQPLEPLHDFAECESILTEHFGPDDAPPAHGPAHDPPHGPAHGPAHAPTPTPAPAPHALKRRRTEGRAESGEGPGCSAAAPAPAPGPGSGPGPEVAAPGGARCCNHPPQDEFDCVGKNVALKLRALARAAPVQGIVAEKLIADVMFHAQLGALSRESHVAAGPAGAAGAGPSGAPSPRAQAEAAPSDSSHP